MLRIIHGSKKERKRIARTPTVLQMEAVECGAACLGMILGYFGKFISIEELRYKCGISRDGSKASNILSAAREYGLEARGFKMNVDLLKESSVPSVIFWKFSHFVVLEGVRKKYFYINDPASGKTVVHEDDFKKGYSGVVLSFSPGVNFKKGGKKPSVLKTLLTYIKNEKKAFYFILFSGLIMTFFGLIIPSFSKIFIDEILIGDRAEWFNPLIIAMSITAILVALITWLEAKVLLKLEMKIAIISSSRYFWHVIRLPIVFFAQRYAGTVSNVMSSNDLVAEVVASELSSSLLNLFFAFFFLLLMFQYDIFLTLVSLGFAVINILIIYYTTNKMKNLYKILMKEEGKLVGSAMAGVQIIETLKAMAQESIFFNKIVDEYSELQNTLIKIRKIQLFLSAAPKTTHYLSTSFLLLVGGMRIMQGDLSLGSYIAFETLMVSFSLPVEKLMEIIGSVQKIEADLFRLSDVVDYKEDEFFTRKSLPDLNITKLEGNVKIEGLTFGYNHLEPPFIENFSLTLKPGTRVALVGYSGSGKSTIGKLVAGLYQPWKGTISFDGVDTKSIPVEVFNRSISYIDQDIYLFTGTLKDNITLWDESVTDLEILTAAKDACIHDEITSFQGGYYYELQELGKNLSGGMRQRVEIARALLKNPSILILDEATSSLDSKTEEELDKNLRKRGCTCIIVAHRLSTIRDCDEIIVLENGKVVQRGKHEDLISIDGQYSKLISMG